MWCTRVFFESVDIRSFLCCVVAGSSRVSRSVSREVRSAILGPGLSPFISLAIMTSVGDMWYVGLAGFVSCDVIRVCHGRVFVSQSGARCLSSLLEYCMGLQCCRTSFSYDVEPIWPYSVLLVCCIVWSMCCEAGRRVVAISFSLWRLGRF